MNCRICGCPLEEGAMFCTNCGAKVDQNKSAFSDAQASAPWQNGGQAYAMPPQAPPVSASPLWQGVRKTLGSKVFLVTAILATVSLGLELIGSFSVRGNEFGNTASVNFGWVEVRRQRQRSKRDSRLFDSTKSSSSGGGRRLR